MRYTDARPLIATGDLLTFRSDGLVSGLIRRWCGGSWSHVGIAYRWGERLFVLAAKEGGYGVCLLACSNEAPFGWVAMGAWSDAAESLALERLGLPYSYTDCARVALGKATVRDDAVCSVYAASVLKAAGSALPLPSYTPSALVDAVMAAGATMREVVP